MIAPSPRLSPLAPALAVLLVAACVLGLAPILVRLTETGPAAAGFWRFAFALPLLAILAGREPGGVARPSKWALLAGLFFGWPYLKIFDEGLLAGEQTVFMPGSVQELHLIRTAAETRLALP